MKEIDNTEVKVTYIFHGRVKSPEDFQRKKEELLQQDPATWGDNIYNYEKSWDEFFKDEVKWYKIEVDSKTHKLVNNIFDSLCMTDDRLGVSFEEMVREYKEKKLPKSEVNKINEIRKNLVEEPRVILVSNSWDKLSVFDGWHRAIAFAAENKPIPAYVGIAKDFTALKIK
tara:strand:- start:348 stop:860 length:513 start_codon:yes stop_codon:yes gene_type:complete